MHIITARQAARVLGITTDALYRRVHNGEIPTIEAGEELQPNTGHREYVFDRDVIAGMPLRPVGRPRIHSTTDCVRTFVRARERERRAWKTAARFAEIYSVSEWIRAHANAEARRVTLKLERPARAHSKGAIVWVRSSKAELRAWGVAADRAGYTTNRWLRFVANAAAK